MKWAWLVLIIATFLGISEAKVTVSNLIWGLNDERDFESEQNERSFYLLLH